MRRVNHPDSRDVRDTRDLCVSVCVGGGTDTLASNSRFDASGRYTLDIRCHTPHELSLLPDGGEDSDQQASQAF
jgi:hypothetical protein